MNKDRPPSPDNTPKKPFSIVEKRIERAAEISFELLRKFFSSPEFVDSINVAHRILLKSKGRETGFVVVKDPSSDTVWFSKPRGSTSGDGDEMEFGKISLDHKKKIDRQHKVASVMFASFHFHPGIHEYDTLTPSSEYADSDLDFLSRDREKNRKTVGFDIMPLEIIAAKSVAESDVYLIVIREPASNILRSKPHIFRELNEAMLDVQNEEDVLGTLRHYGYTVEYFKATNGIIASEELERLRAFAHAPRHIPDEEINQDL